MFQHAVTKEERKQKKGKSWLAAWFSVIIADCAFLAGHRCRFQMAQPSISEFSWAMGLRPTHLS